MVWYSLCKIRQFHLISWCGNFVERQSFRTNSGESPETMRKLCLSTKFPHQEIRWYYCILRSDWIIWPAVAYQNWNKLQSNVIWRYFASKRKMGRESWNRFLILRALSTTRSKPTWKKCWKLATKLKIPPCSLMVFSNIITLNGKLNSLKTWVREYKRKIEKTIVVKYILVKFDD